MSSWWVTTELDEFGGFQRDWYGPFVAENDADAAAAALSKSGQELVAETVFGPAGRDGNRFSEFVRGKKYSSGSSSWFTVKPSQKVAIPKTGCKSYP